MRVRAGILSLLTGGALALSCLAAPVASAARSTAARSPSWHVVYRQAALDVSGVTAASADNAWAYGHGKLGGGKLVHWNGTRWAQVRYPRQNTYLINSAFVLSATDAWFAGQNETPPAFTSEILHWHAGHWSWLQVPSSTNIADVDVLADNDIWSIGGTVPGCEGAAPGAQGCTPVERWDGVGWHSFPLRVAGFVGFASSSRTDVWATGGAYLGPTHPRQPQTFVQYVFRWNGSAWQRSPVAGKRSTESAALAVDGPANVWLAGPTQAAPRACAVHWTGAAWHPFYLGRQVCRGAVTDYRSGFWSVLWPGTNFRGRNIVGFAFLHWTGKRALVTPTYVPRAQGWNTDGFAIAAVPHSSRVWVYGSYCPPTKACPLTGVIATMR